MVWNYWIERCAIWKIDLFIWHWGRLQKQWDIANGNPLSISLLCLKHGISFDEMGKVMVAFNQILRKKKFEDLEVADFRQALEEVTLVAKDFADSVVVAFIKAYARNYISELVPFAGTLD